MALMFNNALSKYCLADVIDGELVLSGWEKTKVFKIDGSLMGNLLQLGLEPRVAEKVAKWAYSQL